MASNYQFLREPEDSLKCLICLDVAKDPKQHIKCGRLFCSKCIEKNGKKPCPNCSAKNPQFFPDMKSVQEIKALHVRCDNLERGCAWKGTVGMFDDHVSKCGFTLVTCPNKCKVEGELSQLMRKDLDDHLMIKCPNKDYECKHCGVKGTYAIITEEHDNICIKKVVPCPNTGCTSAMERGLTEKHVQTVCKYTVVACKYASIGCSVKKLTMAMKQHEEDDQSHFHLALDKIVKLVDAISSQNANISSLKATTSSLKATTSSLKATTSSQNAAISSLKATTSSQNAAISSLKATTSSLKATTSSLKAITSSQIATISSLKDTTSSQNATISSQNVAISTLKATTSSLKATTSSQNATISSLKASTSSLKNTTSSQNATISSLKATTSSVKSTTSSQNATISSLKATTSSQNAAISSLEATTSSLENTLKRDKSMSFNLPGYSKKKNDDVGFNSEPFYTSPGGYKMRIKVYPTGNGNGKGTHVSVYSQLLEGPYDDHLPWPLLGSVTVELLNQLADDNHHSMVIPFETTCNARGGRALGFSTFIPHSELSHNQARNIQYLMDDTLYFRVSVEVDNHKPWLECTHPTK